MAEAAVEIVPETVSVEVREITPDQAPVALVQRAWVPVGEHQQQEIDEYRLFAGGLWVCRDPLPGAVDRPLFELELPEQPEAVDAAAWEQIVAEWAENQLLIHGQLWMPAGEPLLRVVDAPDQVTIEIVFYYPAGACRRDYFPVTDQALALEWAERKLVRRQAKGEVLPPILSVPSFEIRIPQALKQPRWHQYTFRLGSGPATVLATVEARDELHAVTCLQAALANQEPVELDTGGPVAIRVQFTSLRVAAAHIVEIDADEKE